MPEDSTHMARMWERFEDTVIDKDAGKIQRSEMQLAFHSGALIMLRTMVTISQMSEENAIPILYNVENECETFFEELFKGE